uniref:Formylglycine-generating enzyme, required for sulfatase activity, contains SUMF1/FGE domain n=1 Tax=Candidatus Kentrum sp. TC TaxID=2126339 RepID=A0A450ZRP8_9GAMM|nr:MAG: Formylglycine-generating enzyme, required for sulfatase activity, contains SUMF1/FGE domain [Candidatus Kentron sp. TC]
MAQSANVFVSLMKILVGRRQRHPQERSAPLRNFSGVDLIGARKRPGKVILPCALLLASLASNTVQCLEHEQARKAIPTEMPHTNRPPPEPESSFMPRLMLQRELDNERAPEAAKPSPALETTDNSHQEKPVFRGMSKSHPPPTNTGIRANTAWIVLLLLFSILILVWFGWYWRRSWIGRFANPDESVESPAPSDETFIDSGADKSRQRQVFPDPDFDMREEQPDNRKSSPLPDGPEDSLSGDRSEPDPRPPSIALDSGVALPSKGLTNPKSFLWTGSLADKKQARSPHVSHDGAERHAPKTVATPPSPLEKSIRAPTQQSSLTKDNPTSAPKRIPPDPNLPAAREDIPRKSSGSMGLEPNTEHPSIRVANIEYELRNLHRRMVEEMAARFTWLGYRRTSEGWVAPTEENSEVGILEDHSTQAFVAHQENSTDDSSPPDSRIHSPESEAPLDERGKAPKRRTLNTEDLPEGENREFLSPFTRFRDTLKGGGEGPEMMVILAGEFMMGSPENEQGRHPDEDPQHSVRIVKPFALGIGAVTFEDYDHFARATGRKLPNDWRWGRGKRPVIDVDWWNAMAYAEWLSEETHEGYRLPTEAEWEYAARAGTSSPFSTGECIDTSQANHDGNHGYGGCPAKSGVYLGKTVPTGSLPTNPWGLHEMHGNVWEWTMDCWHGSYRGAPSDGGVWLEENEGNCFLRVIRGGSWNSRPNSLRSALRDKRSVEEANFFIGFRLVREL